MRPTWYEALLNVIPSTSHFPRHCQCCLQWAAYYRSQVEGSAMTTCFLGRLGMAHPCPSHEALPWALRHSCSQYRLSQRWFRWMMTHWLMCSGCPDWGYLLLSMWEDSRRAEVHLRRHPAAGGIELLPIVLDVLGQRAAALCCFL